MNIHVIDDNHEITKMLERYFTMKGHNCSVSNDGKNGLAIIQNQNFDVVLLDLAMPGFSGRDIVDQLFKNGKIKNMNIIALTASSPSSEYEEELIFKGVKSILKKPMDPDLLLDYLVQSNKN